MLKTFNQCKNKFKIFKIEDPVGLGNFEDFSNILTCFFNGVNNFTAAVATVTERK